MKLFTSFAVLGLALLTDLHLVLGAPTTSLKASTTPCKTPKHTSTPKQAHTHTSKPPKTTSAHTKHTKTSAPSKTISKATTTSATSTASGCPAPTVPLGGGGPFATVQGRMFQIQSKTQFFAGTNSWWLSQLQSNSDVDNVFSELALTQFKVTRVWGFSDINSVASNSNPVYFQVLNSTGQYFNCDQTTGIGRLDYVVSTAEAKGVKIVMPLLNNYGDLGGIPAYVNAFGGNATSFYTDAKSQAAYKNYVQFIVNRYKTSPAIFAWELANEPRCSQCPSSVITNWATSISAYIKSLDSKHMVALGDEGWFDTPSIGDGSYAYSGYEGVDFVKNLAIPTLDYGTFHCYPDQWGYNNTWPNEWIVQHDAVGKAAGKPVVFEEYGSTNTANHSILMVPWQQTVLYKTSVAYDSFWQFGTSPLSINPFDNYAIYYNTTPGSDYEVLGYQHAAAMLAKNPVANH